MDDTAEGAGAAIAAAHGAAAGALAPRTTGGPTLHVVGLPHTETTAQWLTCAYTQKVVKFCRMMCERHVVLLYAGEANEAPCAEHIPVVDREWQRQHYGEFDLQKLARISWEPAHETWRDMNTRVILELAKRVQPRDIICLSAGVCQEMIATAFAETALVCEPFVGYEGIIRGNVHCAFESYAHMHTVYRKYGIENGRYFDAVIPNFFDPAEFDFHEHPADPPYLLFVGRLIQRKGLSTALDIARRVGLPLKIAGQGMLEYVPGHLLRSEEVTLTGGGFEYIGVLDSFDRSCWMGGASALLCPTTYIEPFGGVAIEAMLCGTPVVASDWGAFAETVHSGVGMRFRTLKHAEVAVQWALDLRRDEVRADAMKYTLNPVGNDFEVWFDSLQTLYGEGWYA
jgi:glycosyltransferase involved in cell wall biosynthesis